jgi:3-methyladenine DNA glycosylase/8-oxoguanine DNA glycosylase
MFVGNVGDRVEVHAWGPGAEWAVERSADLIGLDDDDEALVARHEAVAALAHRMPGLRVGRTGLVLETLLPTIVEQKVTSREAHDSWSHLVHAWGEPAPGPAGLKLPPAPERLAAAPYWKLHRFGLEQRRAQFMIGASQHAGRLEEAATMEPAAAEARLCALPGIGAWTMGHIKLFALGDPDAVVVGDYHLPHLVSAALVGERRGTDDRMLELLEPYRGQRGRVTRLILAGAARASRRAPRRERRDITRI